MKRFLPRVHFFSQMNAILVVHLIWLVTVCLLGAWWGRLLLSQASRIAILEGKLGLSVDLTQSQWHRTQRMLFWEGSVFFLLLLACTGFLFWLYRRDSKRNKGLQAFFASVTHELRTPLTSIRLQAESIAESPPAEISQGSLIRRLLEDTIRLESQVERTLELARVEGGGPVYRQPLQVKPWIDRFLSGWFSDYKDRVEVCLNIEDLVIEADPIAMQIILKNLLENSIKHSRRDQVQIFISTVRSDQAIFLRVQDNGQGYAGDQKSLGRLFFKDPSSQGTGVGLYLVKTLMKKMGGWVEFDLTTGFQVSMGFTEGK